MSAVECIIPILRVQSLSASIDFYIRVLGFQVDWGGDEWGIASVSRDSRPIMLCQGEQGQPGTWVWIGVEDVETIYRVCAARGATIRQTPTNYSWAYEMRIEDPDGHVLRIGSEPRTDQPFHD
jgi:predicted lactoylglutathione lyase